MEVGLDRRGRRHDLRLRQRTTVDDGEERVEHQREPLAAGVDHAGFLEHGEEVGRPLDGLPGGGGGAVEQPGERLLPGPVGGLDGLGRGARHRQDRALDRPEHGLVRSVRRPPEARDEVGG